MQSKQADLGEGTNFMLVVDQFEEIFRFHGVSRALAHQLWCPYHGLEFQKILGVRMAGFNC